MKSSMFLGYLEIHIFTSKSEIKGGSPEGQGAVLIIKREIGDFDGTSAAINSWG